MAPGTLRAMAPVMLAIAAGLAACGGSTGLRPGADGGGDATSSDGAVHDALQLATVAGNGAAIPPPDPKNNCGALDIQLTSCAPPDAMCPNVECDCPAGKILAYGGFTCAAAHGCVASVSCPIACEIGPDVLATTIPCVTNGLCATDHDCAPGQGCVRVPGQNRGSCSSHDERADCVVDSDCLSGACVIQSAASRFCSSREEGVACNRDSHCQSGRCLFESADQYVGTCADGTNGDTCFHANATDCQLGLRCLGDLYKRCSDGANDSLCDTAGDCQPGFSCVTAEFTATGRTCSSGLTGTHCDSSDDCPNGLCVKDSFDRGTCSNRATGDVCNDGSQCTLGYCVSGTCATGEPGARCAYDLDCVTRKCDGAAGSASAHCTDGKVGHTCRETAQCEAGLACNGRPHGLCNVALVNGALCSIDGDCQSGHCRQAPDGSLLFLCAD